MKGQLSSIESAKALLAKDRLNLEQLGDYMAELNDAKVVSMRDWRECRDALLAMTRSTERQAAQLNQMAAVVKTLHSRLKEGLARAERTKQELKSLGKVIKWTKPKN